MFALVFVISRSVTDSRIDPSRMLIRASGELYQINGYSCGRRLQKVRLERSLCHAVLVYESTLGNNVVRLTITTVSPIFMQALSMFAHFAFPSSSWRTGSFGLHPYSEGELAVH